MEYTADSENEEADRVSKRFFYNLSWNQDRGQNLQFSVSKLSSFTFDEDLVFKPGSEHARRLCEELVKGKLEQNEQFSIIADEKLKHKDETDLYTNSNTRMRPKNYLYHNSSAFWYMQSTLLGTDTIVVAEHVDNVSVIAVNRIHIDELETGNENFNANRIEWSTTNTERKLKRTWTKDKLFAHLEAFISKLRNVMHSDEYFNQIVVIEKKARMPTFCITEVVQDRSRLFPLEFQDHFRQCP
ncbi:hypothetical protein L596_022711 [Steinernema carpocapsae]|uniref:Decapping nuclease n=1 Tax=Steinernema carpocapsae TaxID=34508 RepID=A0A4U5MML7_STECR|nr:hypothetical protein L596_022711 [Steinernema carpocapsae]